MDSDDTPVGRLLSRREVLALLGASGALLATRAVYGAPRPGRTARSLPPCVVRPAQTEGPYFVDEALTRSDIRSDPVTGTVHTGALLSLSFLISRVGPGSCQPLPGAVVDVWQCNAEGLYSDVTDPHFDTRGQRFLRGNQATNQEGRATFQTIYPGWYPGRCVHIHFKVRTPPDAGPAREFTSQVYFDDALTDRVHAGPPYAARGQGRTRNAADRIFRNGGEQLLLAPRAVGDGYEASFAVGLQLG